MATTVWNGNGQNIAQVSTLQVTAVAVGGTLTATINGKNITYTCVTGDTVSTAATNWNTLLNASTVPPELGEIGWTVSSDTITATAGVLGTPFTLTKSQAGGATCTLTAVTANSSQSDVNNANNWLRSGSASLPQNGDDVVLANCSVPLLWNLESLAAVQFASFTRFQTHTGNIGLPENNPLGYVEYRSTYFQFASSVGQLPVILGVGTGSGPARERYNVGSARTNLTVIASGNAADAYAVRFLGTHANNTVKVRGTSVGIGMLPAETSTIDIATCDGGGTLDVGSGVTFTGTGGGGTLTYIGGVGTLYCAPATLVCQNNSNVTLSGSGSTYSAITANNGCSLTITAAMTISVLTLQKFSTLDNSNNLGAVTITTSTMDGDTCQVLDPNNGITWTNATTVNGHVQNGPVTFTGARTMKVT